MYRCAFILAAVLAGSAATTAQAQALVRSFPQTALRGELVIGTAPEATLNGKPARLAPGARIRNAQNMMQMSASLSGTPLMVHYTLDNAQEVRDVWILTAEEARRRPWPTTMKEAQAWTFDPVAQTWSKP